jgi:formamidopyrimidine-DNA glycosylase
MLRRLQPGRSGLMPELPEVEHGRRLAEEVMAGRRIENVEAEHDPIVFEGVRPVAVKRTLRGRRVIAAHRRGKHLWLELDRSPHLLVHFGMTGALVTPGRAPLELASSPRSAARQRPGRAEGQAGHDGWPPRFCKLRLELEGGGDVAFVNKRRLGRVRLRHRPLDELPLAGLGFDPLLELPSPRRFDALVASRRGTLKGLLLDQRFAAGVGNWIADEVLYQAGLDPRRSGASLTRDEARRLRTALARVIERAVAADARKEDFPAHWLFHRRWGNAADAVTARGERIELMDVAGRTTAWVPSRQR